VELRVRAHPQLRGRGLFSALKPASERSTELPRIEKGSASTTRSATTVLVDPPRRNLSVYVPSVFRLTATSFDPNVICPASAEARRVGIWSLPPATRYFSFDLPKTRRLPGPAYPSR
jgi:hypothetical protein